MIPADPAPVATPAVPTAALADARALVEGQLAMLTRLAEIGMELAEACGREAKAPPPEAHPDPGLAFARVARAVRMTIALQSRLMKDLADLDRADALAEQRRTDTRRLRLSRLVEQAAEARVAAQREAGEQYWSDEDAVEDEIERLSSEAYERLTDAEDGDLMGRPFDEVVADICADLGLSPAWTARLAAAVTPSAASGAYGAASPVPDPPPPTVILGLVPRIQGSAADRPCVGPLDRRDKPEDDGGRKRATAIPP